ncbi:MAG: trypsin-like peptidase domain-containing protein [Flavobacteriaceae bacterium]|nr:trypsin-like peptidase domain-containing protein [Flavobacteriaceae bacterium]MDP4674503.1 trypsin-like peptidase domain-containing protein [Flavobacteriaceae bacterium]MDP4794386.1 trypsin-like peptidase domain-containing protein [Flavobacteriaceae bacterium]MDP4971196.1 trypsin-like peptidase domain-containing protein [Flavobacteriaceae bacterium]
MKTTLKTVLIAVVSSAATYGVLFWTFPKPKNTGVQPTQDLVTQVAYNQPIAPTEFTTAAEKTIHAVVHVKNVAQSNNTPSLMEFFYGFKFQEAPQVGTGSGVIISPDGYIVTNHHVVSSAQSLEVTLNNNQTYAAQMVGSDPNSDIALLKIEPGEPLPYLPFGDSDQTQIGEWVLAVGNPFNLTSTVTAGIISAKARDLGKNQSFIQTDAAVNPGNSGGALVNTQGHLIGINTAISSVTGAYVGYSFAVPANIAKKVVEDIMEFGTVQTGILGIQTITSPEYLAKERGIKQLEGVYVEGVESASGADLAGVKQGDIIVQIDRVKIKKYADLTGYLSSKRPEDKVLLTLLRDGKTRELPVVLKKRNTLNLPLIGLTVKNLSEEDQKTYKIKKGVKIIGVPEGYKGYGLIGKVIVAVDDLAVENITQAQQVFGQISKYRRTVISMIDQEGEKERLILQ